MQHRMVHAHDVYISKPLWCNIDLLTRHMLRVDSITAAAAAPIFDNAHTLVIVRSGLSVNCQIYKRLGC